MREKRHDISTYSNMMMRHVSMMYSMTGNDRRKLRKRKSLSRLISENAIPPKMRQCHYPARLKQTHPTPSSRQDFLLIATDSYASIHSLRLLEVFNSQQRSQFLSRFPLVISSPILSFPLIVSSFPLIVSI